MAKPMGMYYTLSYEQWFAYEDAIATTAYDKTAATRCSPSTASDDNDNDNMRTASCLLFILARTATMVAFGPTSLSLSRCDIG